MAGSSPRHSSPLPRVQGGVRPREVREVTPRPQQSSCHLGRGGAGMWQVDGRPRPKVLCPRGGGRSHDLLLGLPTCCLLRRPPPGPAPASGCLGAQPAWSEGGGPKRCPPVHPLCPAWRLRPAPPTPGGPRQCYHLVVVGPLAHLATSLSPCFLISERL